MVLYRLRASNNTARAGMPDLDPTFEIGPAIKIKLLESKEDKYQLRFNSARARLFFHGFFFCKPRRMGV